MNKQRLMSLVEHLKKGESDYFDEFYDLTKVSVYYTIKKIINEPSTIQDIMQDSYIKFINSLHKIESNYNPFSYLLIIARNTALDEKKKTNKIDYIDFAEEFDNQSPIGVNIATNHSYEMVTKFDAPLLDYCKVNLTEEEYKILELTVILGYRRVEVAKILNEPKSTINWKYNQILKKVKHFYKEVYNEKI